MQKGLRIPVLLTAWLIVLLFGVGGCKKTPLPVSNPLTPLQTLINTDTTLSLYHRMLLVANETQLLADNSVTLLIPTNNAFRAAGYSELVIDSLAPSIADRIISYQFITQPALPDSNGYTPFPTHLGLYIYGEKDATKQIWFNGASITGDTSRVGKALVYRLNSVLLAPGDSLSLTLEGDSTLTLAAELFRRTGLDTALTPGNYTILAPVNAAFAAAGYDSVGAIDSADLNTMIALAKSHVVPGAFFANAFVGLNNVVTLQGGSLSVSSSGGTLQFKGGGNPVPANVVTANQPAGNTYVIYKIDELLSP